MLPKLVDLNPSWIGAGGEGVTQNGQPVPYRPGVGLHCDCPCGCGSELFVPFANPLDGGPPHDPRPHATWTRDGDTFETLTLHPSIKRVPHNGSCGWHGFIEKGEIKTCGDSVPATPEFIERVRKF